MDLTVLAADHGPVPMNMGAILIFDQANAPTPHTIHALLAERVPTVPRLRQTLRHTPFGAGRPIWVDDPDFNVDRHLDVVSPPGQGEPRELFDIATDLLCRPLPTDRPLWRARLVSAPGHTALVVILHHVLADGLGGLAVLAALADEGSNRIVRDFPQPQPDIWALVSDATRERLHAVRSLSAAVRRALSGLGELGAGRARLIDRTSLNRPTSARRRLTRITVPLDQVVATAHRYGGTVNDVVVAAVTGALLDTLHARGEWPRRLVVSVPISGRTDAGAPGNNTGVLPISVPAIADDVTRLAEIIAATTAARSTVRASSAAPLGAAFRLLHRTGLFQLFIEHQRLVHTFESNLRGPTAALHLAGHRVEALVPLVVTPGNIGVTFTVLSYAGNLTLAVIADPDVVPDHDALTDAMELTITHLRNAYAP